MTRGVRAAGVIAPRSVGRLAGRGIFPAAAWDPGLFRPFDRGGLPCSALRLRTVWDQVVPASMRRVSGDSVGTPSDPS